MMARICLRKKTYSAIVSFTRWGSKQFFFRSIFQGLLGLKTLVAKITFLKIGKTLYPFFGIIFFIKPLLSQAQSIHAVPQVIGHRGAAGLMPENTLPGFEKALQLGVDALELDVRMTQDQQIVVHHDPCLNRDMTCLPNGKRLTHDTKAIRDLSYEDLSYYKVGQLDQSSLYAEKFPDQVPVPGARIPLLKDVLLLARDYQAPVYIEMKTDLGGGSHSLLSDEEINIFAQAVVDVIRDCQVVDQTIVMSFDWRGPLAAKAYDSRVTISFVTVENGYHDNSVWRYRKGSSPWLAGYRVSDFDGSVPKMIKAAGASGWNAYHRDVKKEDVLEAQALGLNVIVWTPDTKRDQKKMLDFGVDGITTNRPDRLLRLLKRDAADSGCIAD